MTRRRKRRWKPPTVHQALRYARHAWLNARAELACEEDRWGATADDIEFAREKLRLAEERRAAAREAWEAAGRPIDKRPTP